MLEPGMAIGAIGAASAAGAAACGFKALRAHVRMVDHALRDGVGRALRSIYEDVVGEPVPPKLTEIVQTIGTKEDGQ